MAEFAKYREITAKLKKRFTLRKPNFREASESFKKLSAELNDFKDYAGYCMLSAAQCEHNIVGSLREQQLGYSGIRSASSTSPKPGSAVSASSLFSSPAASGSSLSPNNQGLERVLQSATLTEFQTWLETARLFKEADEVNGAISAFAHSVQICPEKLLPLVYSEWAEMFSSRQRYFEAAEIYLEGGLLREAIDSLLAGQYFEDAYQCYQELFKLANKEPIAGHSAIPTGISRSNSSISAKSGGQITPQASSRPPIPFFGRQKSSEPAKASTNTSSSSSQPGTLHQAPLRCDGGPFADTHRLTIDDYINVFLLRLYLYDPVRYEYPSPIIPLPTELVQCNPTLRRLITAEEEELEESAEQTTAEQGVSNSTSSASVSVTIAGGSGGQSSGQPVSRANPPPPPDFHISDVFLPFIDFLNCRLSERSISDLIELNMLLETLYLSYRNELRHTIDHDYANGDDTSWSSDDSNSTSTDHSDSEDGEEEVSVVELPGQQQKQTQSTAIYSAEAGAAGEPMPSDASPVRAGRHDSIDDDPPTTTTTTTTKSSSTSGSSSTFEKNDLDDIGLKLEQLALQFASPSRRSGKKPSKLRSKRQSIDKGTLPHAASSEGDELMLDFAAIDRRVAFQQRMLTTEGDNDQELRIQIASKLFPLLNSHQNQLVYLILKNKE